jgi:putative (di)nucleoside polyphosphate hydrolase
MEEYRRGVVAVLCNAENEILLCERSDHPGVWQFPQGGIESGEEPEQAFFRELREEIGNDRCTILKIATKTTKYRWPKSNDHRVGQEHIWILAAFGPSQEPNLARGDGSFRAYCWVRPEAAPALSIDWKRPAMEEGLRNLGLI